MKKYILTMIACVLALPTVAFDFTEDNLEINSNIKAEIKTVIIEEINTVVKENAEKIKNKKQNTDNKIVAEIKKEMQSAIKTINRNCNMRKNIFTRSFVEEQEVQKQRYENMLKWDVPGQIYEYIRLNFDLYKVKDIMASCVYHNETLVVVRFNYASSHVIVYYDYNSKQEPITYIVNPM